MNNLAQIAIEKHSTKIIAYTKRGKKPDVELPYMQIKALRRMAHAMYIFPTALREIFKFFLKSRNLK